MTTTTTTTTTLLALFVVVVTLATVAVAAEPLSADELASLPELTLSTTSLAAKRQLPPSHPNAAVHAAAQQHATTMTTTTSAAASSHGVVYRAPVSSSAPQHHGVVAHHVAAVPAHDAANDLKVMTWNLLYHTHEPESPSKWKMRRRAIIDAIKRESPDVLALQGLRNETDGDNTVELDQLRWIQAHLADTDLKEGTFKYVPEYADQPNYERGCAIFTRKTPLKNSDGTSLAKWKRLEYRSKKSSGSVKTRVLLYLPLATSDGLPLHVFTLEIGHKKKEQDAFLGATLEWVQKMTEGNTDAPVLVIGDFGAFTPSVAFGLLVGSSMDVSARTQSTVGGASSTVTTHLRGSFHDAWTTRNGPNVRSATVSGADGHARPDRVLYAGNVHPIDARVQYDVKYIKNGDVENPFHYPLIARMYLGAHLPDDDGLSLDGVGEATSGVVGERVQGGSKAQLFLGILIGIAVCITLLGGVYAWRNKACCFSLIGGHTQMSVASRGGYTVGGVGSAKSSGLGNVGGGGGGVGVGGGGGGGGDRYSRLGAV